VLRNVTKVKAVLRKATKEAIEGITPHTARKDASRIVSMMTFSGDLRVEGNETSPGEVSLVVQGDANYFTCGLLRSALAATMAVPGRRRIVVDLGELEVITSDGLGVLVGAMRRANERGIGFEVVSIPPWLRKILEITGVDKVLGVRPPRDKDGI